MRKKVVLRLVEEMKNQKGLKVQDLSYEYLRVNYPEEMRGIELGKEQIRPFVFSFRPNINILRALVLLLTCRRKSAGYWGWS
mgnify:CR=1 FL=1